MAEQWLNLRLCADIAADPRKLAVESTVAGWLLFFHEDGERHPINLQRLERVVLFWRGFARNYLSDVPAIRRAGAPVPAVLRVRPDRVRMS